VNGIADTNAGIEKVSPKQPWTNPEKWGRVGNAKEA